MSKFQLIFPISLISTLVLYSQSDYREGYIIDYNNDTTFGFIEFKGTYSNARWCYFKKDLDSQKITYTPSDISAYRYINDKFYISKNINTGEDDEFVFMEYLIDGIVDVFCYNDGSLNRYFITNKEGKLIELPGGSKEIFINGKKYTKENKKYVGILKYVLNESPKINQKINNVSLNHKSLINIANDYHNDVCSDKECVIYEKKNLKSKWAFGPIVGINYVSPHVKGDNLDNYRSEFDKIDIDKRELYYINEFQDNQKNLSYGLFFSFNMPNVNEKLYFQYEFKYSRDKTFIENIDAGEGYYSFFNYERTMTFNHTRNLFMNQVIFKYDFIEKMVVPNFQFGGFLNYSSAEYERIYKTTIEKWIDVDYEYSTTVTKFTNYPLSVIDIGFSVGAGIKVNYLKNKYVFLDVRYEQGHNISSPYMTHNCIMNLGIKL